MAVLPASSCNSLYGAATSKYTSAHIGLTAVHITCRQSPPITVTPCMQDLSVEDVQRRSGRDLDTNVWAHKPAWCQPWSILGTGAGFVGLVNTISGHSALWTGIASVPILVWWYVFLVAYPAEFKSYVLSQRGDL